MDTKEESTKTWSRLYHEKKTLLAQEHPPRARNAAQSLGISEAQYVALSCGETANWIPKSAFAEILQSLHTLGTVMALTRNDQVVLEHHGHYRSLALYDGTATVNGDGLDLELWLEKWAFGFFVEEAGRKSLQFFEATGVAAHKIYMTDESNDSAYSTLVSTYVTEPCPSTLLEVVDTADIDLLPRQLDDEALQESWQSLRDFDASFWARENGLSLPQAYRHLTQDAVRLGADALKRLLIQSAEAGLSMLISAPNTSVVQVHHGLIHKIEEMGPWINVLDDGFNLHGFQPGIAESWRVKKYLGPDVYYESVEFFDEKERLVLAICLDPDIRTLNEPVDEWTTLLNTISTEAMVA